MVGQTISHYKVLEKIGQGGMGEVYRVENTSLKREVAIKVLPAAVHSRSPNTWLDLGGGQIGFRFSLDLSAMINQGTAIGRYHR